MQYSSGQIVFTGNYNSLYTTYQSIGGSMADMFVGNLQSILVVSVVVSIFILLYRVVFNPFKK